MPPCASRSKHSDFEPLSRGADFLQTVRKHHTLYVARKFRGPCIAEQRKIAKIGSLRDHREPRIEFSHGLLDFCTIRRAVARFTAK